MQIFFDANRFKLDFDFVKRSFDELLKELRLLYK